MPPDLRTRLLGALLPTLLLAGCATEVESPRQTDSTSAPSSELGTESWNWM